MLFIKNFFPHFNLLKNKSLAILNGLFYITCLLSLAMFLVNPDVATKIFTAAAMLSVFIIANNINALKHNKKLLLLPLAMLFLGLLQVLWVEFFKHPNTLFSGAYRSYQNGGKTLIFSSIIITAIYCKKNISNNTSRIIPGAVIAISLSLYAFGVYQLYINTHFQLTDYRVNLGFEHATGTAYALTFVALLVSQTILNKGSRWAMLFYVLHFILSLAVIIATQTRSAILVYPVLCIILFFLHYRHHRHIAMATGATFLAIIVLTCIPLKTMLESRFQDIRNDIKAYQTDNSQTSIGSRLAMQRAGYKAGINHLWGQSLEQRNTYIMRLANADYSLTGATEYLAFHLHNEFIDTFSLKGLPGVLLLLALYGSLLYTAFIIRCPLTLTLSVAIMMFGLSDLLFYAKGEALSCMLTLCVGLILMLNAKKRGEIMITQPDYLLSIIIPSYNNAQFIRETLLSLHNSGITDEVEIIIINDGSTDNTDEQIDIFYQNISSSNIKYMYQQNQGVAISRNMGLDNATGKYIGFVDSDDIVSANYFDILLPMLRREKYDLIEFLLTRNINKLYPNNNVVIRKCEIMLKNISALIPTFRAAQWHLASKIFHRDIIGQDRFEEHRRYEDMIFCPFQYFKCTNLLKIECNLYYYRVNKGSITENLKDSDVRHIFFAMNKMCRYIQNNNDKKTIATLMIINCFLEGRKVLRKKKGYYRYEEDMLSDIHHALACCDQRVIKKRIIYKMKYPSIDRFISSTRYHILKACKNILSRKGR